MATEYKCTRPTCGAEWTSANHQLAGCPICKAPVRKIEPAPKPKACPDMTAGVCRPCCKCPAV